MGWKNGESRCLFPCPTCHTSSPTLVTWCVPFMPAYRVEFSLSFPLLSYVPFSWNSIQKHLVTYVLGMECARPSLIGNSDSEARELEKNMVFWRELINLFQHLLWARHYASLCGIPHEKDRFGACSHPSEDAMVTAQRRDKSCLISISSYPDSACWA